MSCTEHKKHRLHGGMHKAVQTQVMSRSLRVWDKNRDFYSCNKICKKDCVSKALLSIFT